MYNNEITYAKHWDTPENRAALEKLQRKYFDKSECAPDCPVAWAPEVLELMDKLERELGFLHNTQSMRGYYIKGDLTDWFIKNPWLRLFSTFRSNFFGDGRKKRIYSKDYSSVSYISKPFKQRLSEMVDAFISPIKYGFRASIIKYINPIRNKIEKRKITLGQLKEKYGELTCYFHTSDAYEEYVDREIRKTELKLAMKGAYYPVEGFWDSGIGYSVGTEYRPDTITTSVRDDGTISVSETKYRSLMKELGLDLKAIKEKAEIRKSIKDSI